MRIISIFMIFSLYADTFISPVYWQVDNITTVKSPLEESIVQLVWFDEWASLYFSKHV